MSDDVGNLLRQLGDNDINVRIGAADALAEIGERALKPLCDALRDGKWPVRASAAYALGGIGGTKAIDALCRALGDRADVPGGSYHVRISVVDALTRIGKPAVEPLCEVLAQGDKEARWDASSALEQIRDSRAVEPLCQALGDYDSDIRACAVCALGAIGAPAVEKLCLLILVHKDWVVRACAANALARIKDARAIEPLREALRRIDNPMRKFASWAFDERLDFASGVRQTARASEADSLRSALKKIGGSSL